MKRYILPVIMLSVVAVSHATEPEDSIPVVTELDEIVVTSEAQRVNANKKVYLPSSTQRSTASDGVSLLSQMQIPHIAVNPNTEKIQTISNQEVSLFINSTPATQEDVKGLNPKDVKRVEYLDFPTDPRFMQSPHVVNFITHTYTHGGYTKLSGKERFFIRSGDASVYSKFAYGKMEYDLMASGDYDYNSHVGSSTKETYRLLSGIITRESSVDDGCYRKRGFCSALRVSWNKSDKFTFRNLVSFRRVNTPEYATSGNVNIAIMGLPEKYKSDTPSANNALQWNSELYAAMTNGWSISGSSQAKLIKSNTTSNYVTQNELIENHAKEGSWWLRGDLQANKNLSDRVTLFSRVSSGGGHTKIDYTGTSNAMNRFHQIFTGIYLGVSYNLNKVSGSIDGGYAFESNYINGITMYEHYPFTHVNLQYAPNRKNSISLWLQYAAMSPNAMMKNPNIIRQSELMYVGGNPNLKCARHITTSVSYLWLPSDKLQLTTYALLFRIINRQIAVYSLDGPGSVILKQYHNDGDYNHGQIGASMTVKFFGGKLSLSVSPRLLLYNVTGSNNIAHYPFTASATADYYLGKFFFNAYCDTGSSYVDGETAFLSEMPMSYSISAGWSCRGWNLQFTVVNPFQSSWKVSNETLNTRWYDSNVVRYGSDFHRRISLSVTYTLNYGNSVNKAGELSVDDKISTSSLR